MEDGTIRGVPLSFAASGSNSISIPLSLIVPILIFFLGGMLSFLVWIVKQITLQSRFQAETVVVLKGLAETSTETRRKVEELERSFRDAPRRTGPNR